ncbi:unnamed protein product [Meganyctiphanes norvegica]|uniref:BED-type domain-containing protein n=1 Tax=Meganyctiphanes norvegica TaxID=48144 RepID=A0AAV2RW75_MEGNR
MASKQTIFNTEWIKDKEFSSWVVVDPKSNTKAHCNVCGHSFQLGNMGRKALTSHAKGKKHNVNVRLSSKVKQETQSIDSFFSKPSSTSMENDIETIDECQLVEPSPLSFPLLQKVEASNYGAISKFGIHDQVLTAEILWVIKTVASHYSSNSSEKLGILFKRMFPDSPIAQKFKCGKTKCSYLIQFGLAVFFREDLSSKILQPGTIFVACFDESLNKVLQEEQMDLYLRFWDSELNKVVTRYFDSVFLGHTRSEDLLINFKECLSKLNMANLLQISMDGPNSNWKFYNNFVQDRQETDPDIPILINIGSCGLHVVHGAFKYGASKTGWKLDGVMRAIYYCFSDSPARRDDYLAANGSNAQFALQFCSTRWIEDVPVAERAIKIWPNIKKYVSTVEKLCKSKQPKCQSWTNLKEYTKDELILAKLYFFLTIAKVLVPFLELFQTDKPMMPFLS